MVAPKPLGEWQKDGRLRLLLSASLPRTLEISVELNGQLLRPSANSSSLYPPGVQANGSRWPQSHWNAWSVPATVPRTGINSLTIVLHSTRATNPSPVPRGPLNNTDLQPSLTYNHTYKHYVDKEAGALACQHDCDEDPRCEAWSYVVGGGQWGRERCCFHGVRGCVMHKVGVYSGARTAGSCSSNHTEIKVIELRLAMPVQSHVS